MSSIVKRAPRVFLIRHGETEWSQLGKHTGRTDIELTANGKAQVIRSGKILIGSGKIIDPQRVVKIFVSPRIRAQQTYQLLFPSTDHTYVKETSENIREWEYGRYEGLLTSEIKSQRKDRGLDINSSWNIWVDGCEDGESPTEVTDRLDKFIIQIKEIQKLQMHEENSADVVVIAHGHILRAFAKRWVGFELSMNLRMILEPGAIGVLSYDHNNIHEPAILLGVNFGSEGSS
ncbi:Sedoheptulose 1,7-bisphosphatase [Erysiphe necator]|uniref:Putative phosphoglycerate mutase family protein n=1 Tax=Uncinula necator TaxID=52586 RepID=A0A0B1P685_UNCNE|nr:Sedoheptulose 1,7-bisphosphatase [Erysiphe necator]KHJ32456.1 putative phosphoglycerate mutase family protein [Erysiphe necator]